MTDREYKIRHLLVKLFDEISNELSFDLSLATLIANQAVWKTEMEDSLQQAQQALVRSSSGLLSKTQQTHHALIAEMMIRHLIESLQSELTEFHSRTGPNQYPRSKHRRFNRQGRNIEVVVGRNSDTNFFADLSFDVQSGGLFIATYDILEVGTLVNVLLVLPRKRSYSLQGRVAWVRESRSCAEDISPGMGIAFPKLSGEPRSAIRNYMSKRPPLLYEMA